MESGIRIKTLHIRYTAYPAYPKQLVQHCFWALFKFVFFSVALQLHEVLRKAMSSANSKELVSGSKSSRFRSSSFSQERYVGVQSLALTGARREQILI